jgi:opacity protein-like surface antigen
MKIIKFLSAICATSLIFTSAAFAGPNLDDETWLSFRGEIVFPADITGIGSSGDVRGAISPGMRVGVLHGVNMNLIVEGEGFYNSIDLHVNGVKLATAQNFGISAGAQWRFLPRNVVSPYVGAGGEGVFTSFHDINESLITSNIDSEVAFGGYVSAGCDLFTTRAWALNIESRYTQIYSVDMRRTDTGAAVGNYDPSHFSIIAGVRLRF